MKRTGLAFGFAVALGCTLGAHSTLGGQGSGTPSSGTPSGGQGSGGQGEGQGSGSGATRQGTGTAATSQNANGRVMVIGCVQSGAPASSANTPTGTAGSTESRTRAFTLTNARVSSTAGVSSGAGAGRTSTGAAGTSAGSGSGTTGNQPGATGSTGSGSGSTPSTSGGSATGAGAAGTTAGATGSGGSTTNAQSTSGAGGSGSSFLLEGSDLAQHIGHQVEVTGTLISNASGQGASGRVDSGTVGGSPTARDNAAPGDSGNRPNSGGTVSTPLQPRLMVMSVRTIAQRCETR